MIRIIIADDHQIVVDGLISLLKEENNIEVMASFLNGSDAFEYLLKHDVDVAVLDINMPEMNGVEATKKIVEAGIKTKVLILSMYDDYEFIGQLLEAGCSGYILKNKGHEELIKGIKKLYNDEEYYGEKVLDEIIAAQKKPKSKSSKLQIKLTKREIEIIKLIAKEFTTPQISAQLHIAKTTVDTHRRNMISKLGVKGTLGLVRYAWENGLME